MTTKAPASPVADEYSQRSRLIADSGLFDADWYLREYPDVALVGIDPLEHYVRIGCHLERNPSAQFDAGWYIRQNPAVRAAGLDALHHYLKWGRRQGWKIRAVGASHPRFERDTPVRAVSRRVPAWDADRESHFLSAIGAIHAADPGRFDALRVSIVMPTHNRSQSIGRAIDSVVSQSHANWRLNIADDGSTDETAEVVARYRSDPRIHYLPGEQAGVSAARNRALRNREGEYVFYLDSDNTWREDFLRTMLVFMEHGGLAAAYSAARCEVDAGRACYFRGDDFDWAACLHQNYVDMNCFGHRAELVDKWGEFDQELKRLVDWDLILRYTRHERTAFAPFVGVSYDDTTKPDRITHREYRDGNALLALADRIRHKHRDANDHDLLELRPVAEALLVGTTPTTTSACAQPALPQPARRVLRIGYVLWDWPALSQTFVLNELRRLVELGHDVQVYFKVEATPAGLVDFAIAAHKVDDAAGLAKLLREHRREVLHSPFAYPSATLLLWPAALETGLPYTFMAGGVDVAHYENMRRNRVGEVASSELCLGVITLGSFHRDLLLDQGVPSSRIVMERQAVELPEPRPSVVPAERPRILAIGRFIEKKGFEYLVRAAALLPHVDVLIHGYGPLEEPLRNLAANLGARNVQFRGALATTAELHAAYANADVFALPCVRAANGDLDGLPTVLLEAMAAGVPVVSTRIANIPDLVTDGATGFLCEPGSVDGLASALATAVRMPESSRRAMVATARERVVRYASIERNVETLVATWSRKCIDIVLVTYDTERHANLEDTVEIIDRLYRYTASRFELYVVDNASRPELASTLRRRFSGRSNFHLIELPENVFCGPASNIGFAEGSSDYIIYVCSKEGFILRHGWERQFVRALDADPRVAMAGHLVALPRFRSVAQLENYPSFEHWRAQEHVLQNPDPGSEFRHVQGGLFALRRSAFQASGGFNPATPQGGMDVEFSHFLCSIGFRLAQVPGLAAVTAKTLPPLPSLVDEFSFAVHPSSVREVGTLDGIVARRHRFCPLCRWTGEAFAGTGEPGSARCPQCGASAFSRTAYRLLSFSGALQSRPRVAGVLREASLGRALATLCPRQQLLEHPPAQCDADLLARAVAECEAADVLVIDRYDWGDTGPLAAETIARAAASGLTVLVAAPSDASLAQAFSTVAGSGGCHAHTHVLVSEACSFDPLGVMVLSPHPWPEGIQGLDC